MSGKITYSDADYIEAIKADNDMLLQSLYELYFPMILNFVLNNSGSEHEAKDIYQEGFITLYNNVKKEIFKQNSGIKTYLYSVCRHKWLDHLKLKKRNIGRIEDFESIVLFTEQEDEEMFIWQQKFELVKKCLEMLGEPCKSILHDFYISRMSMQQITEKMGYTNSGNAKTQKYKCLQRLKRLVLKNEI